LSASTQAVLLRFIPTDAALLYVILNEGCLSERTRAVPRA
jgi:hypothetical protein